MDPVHTVLTRDLLRYQVRDGVVAPGLLRATPANVATAERLIAHWRGGVGQCRGDLEDAATPVLHQSRGLVVAKGLQKLIVDQCRFSDPESCERRRREALLLSARRLAAPAAEADAHRAEIAAELGSDGATLERELYGDLPHLAVLASAGDIAPAALLSRYNLATCQGLLLHASELRIRVTDADTGLRRRLLKALRWRRLLARIGGDDEGALDLVVSGPASVLDQSTRYGLQLALFLPALACARAWSASAELSLPRGGGRARLELSDALSLPGDSAFLGHVPEELRDLEATFSSALPEWRSEDPALLPLPDGEIVVPDLQLRADHVVRRIELFHRWHASALGRRMQQLERGWAPGLLIGVDRALARTVDATPLVASAAFARHGFLFTGLPTARTLREALDRPTSRSAEASR